jgi:hypothetical protein
MGVGNALVVVRHPSHRYLLIQMTFRFDDALISCIFIHCQISNREEKPWLFGVSASTVDLARVWQLAW